MSAALASYGALASTLDDARSQSPPPIFSTVRDKLNQPDYSLQFPKPSDLTPQLFVKSSTTNGLLERFIASAEGLVLAAGDSNGLENQLVASLLQQVDSHPEMQQLLREAEDQAGRALMVNTGTLVSRAMALGSRLISASQPGSVGSILRVHATRAVELLRPEPSACIETLQPPESWLAEVERSGARITTLDRALAATAEQTILSLQNEQISKSNASHARIAERTAAKIRKEQEQVERAAQLERERVERLAREAAARRAARLERQAQAEREARRKAEEDAERKQRMHDAAVEAKNIQLFHAELDDDVVEVEGADDDEFHAGKGENASAAIEIDVEESTAAKKPKPKHTGTSDVDSVESAPTTPTVRTQRKRRRGEEEDEEEEQHDQLNEVQAEPQQSSGEHSAVTSDASANTTVRTAVVETTAATPVDSSASMDVDTPPVDPSLLSPIAAPLSAADASSDHNPSAAAGSPSSLVKRARGRQRKAEVAQLATVAATASTDSAADAATPTASPTTRCGRSQTAATSASSSEPAAPSTAPPTDATMADDDLPLATLLADDANKSGTPQEQAEETKRGTRHSKRAKR